MGSVRFAIPVLLAGLLAGACAMSSDTRKSIEGNSTGGIIPPLLTAGNNPQTLADNHCARWNTRARITFSGAEAGGDTVFVCETESGPAILAIQPDASEPGPQAPSPR